MKLLYGFFLVLSLPIAAIKKNIPVSGQKSGDSVSHSQKKKIFSICVTLKNEVNAVLRKILNSVRWENVVSHELAHVYTKLEESKKLAPKSSEGVSNRNE